MVKQGIFCEKNGKSWRKMSKSCDNLTQNEGFLRKNAKKKRKNIRIT